VADDLILPVPELLSAAYLVPGSLPADYARERARAAVEERLGGHLRATVGEMLASPMVTFSLQRASALPALPTGLQQYLGVTPEQVRAVTDAADLVALHAVAAPQWPPLHEWCARAGASALAAELGVPLVDAFIPQVLSAEQSMAALPGAGAPIRLTDWVLVFQSAGELGMWATTKGLGRFGLPELQVCNVPPQLAQPSVYLLSGLASRLLALWLGRLGHDGQQAFVQVPSEIEVSETDVARAYATPPRGGGSAFVRLAPDPAADGRSDSLLTVLPPDDYPASPGEHLADVCAALFGAAEPDVRQLAPSQAMEQAVRRARESLQEARERFISDELPLKARLMVKYRVPATDGDGYLWAYVTAWPTPETVMGYTTGEAVSDPRLREGRPVVIETSSIIDWAIWTDSEGIIEGGWTNQVVLDQTREIR
jgi:hypothetical protein